MRSLYMNHPVVNALPPAHLAGTDIRGHGPLRSTPELFDMLRDPLGWARARYERFGPVSFTHVLGRPIVLMLGPEANEQILLNRDQVWSSKEGWNWYIEAFFKRGLMLRDGEEHLYHRRIMQAAFRTEALKDYLQRMQPEIESLTDAWLIDSDQDQTIRFMFPTLKELTLQLASRIFLGQEPGKEADRLNLAFVDAVMGGGAWVRRPVPGNLWWKGTRGRRYLERYFYDQLPTKRRSAEPDFFSQLCHATDEHGNTFSDEDVVDHMIFLLMAAHDTTNITMNTMTYYLAHEPEWQERCRAESLALGKSALGFGDLPALDNLFLVMKEGLRMVPPVPGLPRVAKRDTEFQHHRIPKGTMINLMMEFTHTMPDLWTNPLRFDPERFLPDRAEDKNHRYGYMPFGGGIHKCLGMHFAEMQVKAIFHNILQKYRLRIDPGYPLDLDHTSLPRPRHNLPVLIERL